MQESDLVVVHGPREPAHPLVLDSPHSGRGLPADFGTVLDATALRSAEDCFVDRLYLPATQRGVPLLAAQWSRVYLDANRHADDIDPDLLDAPWPHAAATSRKAALGKALAWRTLDDGRAVYARRLSVQELQERISRCHTPYHRTLQQLLDGAHARFGSVLHLNCHSMNAVAGANGEGVGRPRADFVLGDRDGTTCDPALTTFVQRTLAAMGYDVKVNDPFKGVALVQAYCAPAAGRHSLQIEINKRLYMDEATLEPHAGFDALQRDLMRLIDALIERVRANLKAD
jgi:N-formylglutamate amidohydrolase